MFLRVSSLAFATICARSTGVPRLQCDKEIKEAFDLFDTDGSGREGVSHDRYLGLRWYDIHIYIYIYIYLYVYIIYMVIICIYIYICVYCFYVHTFYDINMYDIYIYGYGSIPMKIQFLGGWTSINPSYFDVNYRGTRFWHTAIYIFVCVYYIHGHHMYLYIYVCVFYFYVYTHILWYKHVWYIYIYVLICIVCNIYTCGCGSNYMTSIRTLDPQAIHTHNPIIHL